MIPSGQANAVVRRPRYRGRGIQGSKDFIQPWRQSDCADGAGRPFHRSFGMCRTETDRSTLDPVVPDHPRAPWLPPEPVFVSSERQPKRLLKCSAVDRGYTPVSGKRSDSYVPFHCRGGIRCRPIRWRRLNRRVTGAEDRSYHQPGSAVDPHQVLLARGHRSAIVGTIAALGRIAGSDHCRTDWSERPRSRFFNGD